MPPGNPFDDPAAAATYEEWYAGPGRRADELEKGLLAKLLAEFPGARTGLEVGSGTGHFARWLETKGVRTFGLDRSWAMLAEAGRRGGPVSVQGDAHALPFLDRSFDVVLLITTLEFVAVPARAVGEAVRVARRGVILGVLNRWSGLAIRYRLSRKTVWKAARFFSVWELERLIRRVARPRFRSLTRRTTLWPLGCRTDLPLPWGGFIGIAVHLTHEAKDP